MGSRALAIGASLCFMLLTGGSAWAGSPEGPLPQGTIEWGVMTGYGRSFGLGASKPGIDFIALLPRLGYVVTELGGPFSLKGSVTAIAEAVPALVAFESQTIYGGGFNLLLRYDVATGTRFAPFLEGGAGILLSTPQSTDRESQFRASQFNFTLQIAPGLRYMLTKQVALNVEYRFHHISDARLTERDPGINSHFVLMGLSLFH